MIKRKISESEIQSQIIDYLNYRVDLFFQRTNNTPVYDPKTEKFRKMAKGQKKGFSDLIVLKKGVLYCLEVKTKNGKQSDYQKKMEKLVNKNGGVYAIVRSLEDVIRIIDK